MNKTKSFLKYTMYCTIKSYEFPPHNLTERLVQKVTIPKSNAPPPPCQKMC